jgi:hypothetical protein
VAAPEVEFQSDLDAAVAAVRTAQNQASIASAQTALNSATADYRTAVQACGSAPGPGTRAAARAKFDVVLPRAPGGPGGCDTPGGAVVRTLAVPFGPPGSNVSGPRRPPAALASRTGSASGRPSASRA